MSILGTFRVPFVITCAAWRCHASAFFLGGLECAAKSTSPDSHLKHELPLYAAFPLSNNDSGGFSEHGTNQR
jgi:hypothetical protein